MTPTDENPCSSATAAHAPTAGAEAPGTAAGRPIPMRMWIPPDHSMAMFAASMSRETGGVLNESDLYREWAPPEQWRHAVACVWEQRVVTDRLQRVVPDGHADLLIH